ncbi:hypothetical protein [Faecalispora jeddahensis]|uniref:hypothetical protein n=1 Tax=Faecalispora jeddahensis TaxID=1414721 RepID=UPI0027BA6056|nr:hypothetical protein [Faecalispora jeddahensis]
MKLSDRVTPEINRIKAELEALNHLRIKVGIQGDEDSDLLMIAHVHEYGATITAKRAKNLAIPIHKDSYGKSPRDFEGLFFIESDAGYVFGVVAKKGRKDLTKEDNLKFLFLLLPSVTIPERSFIRAGYDHNVNRLAEVVKDQVHEIIFNDKSARQAAEYIGGKAVDFIKEYINTASNFKSKGDIQQKAAPTWAGSPLVVTGRLRNSITFVVEEKQ